MEEKKKKKNEKRENVFARLRLASLGIRFSLAFGLKRNIEEKTDEHESERPFAVHDS